MCPTTLSGINTSEISASVKLETTKLGMVGVFKAVIKMLSHSGRLHIGSSPITINC